MDTARPRHRHLLAVILLAVTFLVALAPSAGAQRADDLDVRISPRRSTVHLGDFVTFTVTLRNRGNVAFPDLFVRIGTPDAIDPREVDCPGEVLAVNECHLGALQPGKKVTVRFTVEISHRENSGSVTAFVSDASETTIDQVSTRFLKVLG
jgi:uncharacterized protein DUF11